MAKPKEKKTRVEEDSDDAIEEEEGNEEQAADPSATSSKKKKKQKLHARIETYGENPDKMSPIVGYFPSGYDPLRKRTAEYGDDEAKVRVYKNVNRTNRLQLVVSPNSSQVDFVGTNYSGEATAAQLCTYGLGLLDKATQTLKIVPIAANKIFRLEPRVRGQDQLETESPDAVKQELTAEETAGKMRDLTLMYTSKKTIRQAQKLDSLRPKEDAETKVHLDQKMKGIKINKEALDAATASNIARNIPPHDLAADTHETAYPLDKIIFKGEWDYLLDIRQLLQSGSEVAPDAYPTFVCNRIHKLEYIKDEEEKRQLAGIFSYITHLLKFKDKHSMDGVSFVKHHKIPGILSRKFSSMFTDTDSKRLSDEKRDLLISYVLVLTLYADSFRTNPSDIAKDLRMNAVALRPHYEYLGCKLVREKQVLLATLPTPLQFPPVRRKRRR